MEILNIVAAGLFGATCGFILLEVILKPLLDKLLPVLFKLQHKVRRLLK